MGYEDAFAAVPGVTVEWYEEFGCYQGRMCAKIRIEGKDEPEYIIDSYGSCSGCDSFEAEFGYNDESMTPDRLASFGKSYVDASMTLEQAVASLTPKPGGWQDEEEAEMLRRIMADYPDKELRTGIFTRLQDEAAPGPKP